MLEEACEVIDAIDSGDRKALREELGDLLLQVVFQAELARREGKFAIDDVVEGIVAKLVSRHPHVFGDLDARDADEVLTYWEKLKAKEKGERGCSGGAAGHAGTDARPAYRREGGARRVRLEGRARVTRQGRRGDRRARSRGRERRQGRHRGGARGRPLRPRQPVASRRRRRRGAPGGPSTSSPAASPTWRSACARSTAAGARPGEGRSTCRWPCSTDTGKRPSVAGPRPARPRPCSPRRPPAPRGVDGCAQGDGRAGLPRASALPLDPRREASCPQAR